MGPKLRYPTVLPVLCHLCSAKVGKPNPAFASDVRNGMFYYMDKFVLLTCAAKMLLFNYTLDPLLVIHHLLLLLLYAMV